MGEYVKGCSSDWIEGAEHKESVGRTESKYCPVFGNYHKCLQKQSIQLKAKNRCQVGKSWWNQCLETCENTIKFISYVIYKTLFIINIK